QLGTALSIADIAAVTVHYNVGVRLGAAVRRLAQDAGMVFSPWHPAALPRGDDGRPIHALIDPIAEKHAATPQQIALAWQLHRSEHALPIPGTTSIQHLEENLAASAISLIQAEVDAITALAPEDTERSAALDVKPSDGLEPSTPPHHEREEGPIRARFVTGVALTRFRNGVVRPARPPRALRPRCSWSAAEAHARVPRACARR